MNKPSINHNFRKTLDSQPPQLGLCIMYPSPGVVERIGGDWDWVWVDGQHGELGYGDVIGLVRSCDLVGRPAFIRVPGHEAGPIGMALDTGAAGVIVPCVDTPAQAAQVVRAAKFPPMGNRSYGGRRPIDRIGRGYAEEAHEIMVIVQIESPEAVINIDEIAAVPGVDGIFLGPDDIMLRRGYSMNEPRTPQSLGADMEAVTNAAKKHGKIAVTVGAGAGMLELCLELGFQMIVCGGDVAMLATTSKQLSADARAIVEAAKAKAAPDGNRTVMKTLY